MTELIVAIDLDGGGSLNLRNHLHEVGVRWFKYGTRVFFEDGGWNRVKIVAQESNLFLDLKLYRYGRYRLRHRPPRLRPRRAVPHRPRHPEHAQGRDARQAARRPL
jgi:hypothetical protein